MMATAEEMEIRMLALGVGLLLGAALGLVSGMIKTVKSINNN